MQILGHATAGRPAFIMGFDASTIVTRLRSIEEVRALAQGTVVGDVFGGVTFSDAVASALEARSLGGWQEVEASPGDRWTVIVVNR